LARIAAAEKKLAEAKSRHDKQLKKMSNHYCIKGQSVGGTFPEYQAAVSNAVDLHRLHKMTIAKSIALTHQKFPGIRISKVAVKHGVVGVKVRRIGRQRGIHEDDEKELVEIVLLLRKMYNHVGQMEVVAMANSMLDARPDIAMRFKRRKVGTKWYKRWLRDNNDRLAQSPCGTLEYD